MVDTAPDRLAPIEAHAPAARRSFDFGGRVRQTIAVAARGWREIAATKAFLLILAGAMLLVFTVGWDVGTEIFGTSAWPLTHLIADNNVCPGAEPDWARLVVARRPHAAVAASRRARSRVRSSRS